MRAVLSLFIAVFLSPALIAQDDLPTYPDTVEIADFLESLYKQETKYAVNAEKWDELEPEQYSFQLTEVVINHTYDVPEGILEGFNGFSDENNADSLSTPSTFRALKARLGLSADSIVFPGRVSIRKCRIGETNISENGDMRQVSWAILFDRMHFNSLGLDYNVKGDFEIDECNIKSLGCFF